MQRKKLFKTFGGEFTGFKLYCPKAELSHLSELYKLISFGISMQHCAAMCCSTTPFSLSHGGGGRHQIAGKGERELTGSAVGKLLETWKRKATTSRMQPPFSNPIGATQSKLRIQQKPNTVFTVLDRLLNKMFKRIELKLLIAYQELYPFWRNSYHMNCVTTGLQDSHSFYSLLLYLHC